MAYGVYSDRGYREHILERNKNTNKTETFTQEDQTFSGRKTFLSGITTSDIEAREVNVTEKLTINGNDITQIINYLPNDVSELNKLTTENFVNSSIGTNTAYFRGTFNSLAELEAYAGEKTNNDYVFVIGTDLNGNTVYNRYKYNSKDEEWVFEYPLNNSSFTSEQWAAINSGITEELVAQIGQGGSIRQIAFDSAHPVNDKYLQFPGDPEPEELYNKNGIQSTWQDISSHFAGLSMRFAGGLAEEFNKQLTVQSKDGNKVTFTAAHGLTLGSLIVNLETHTQYSISAIDSATVVTLNETPVDLQNNTTVLICQNSGLPNLTGAFPCYWSSSHPTFTNSNSFYFFTGANGKIATGLGSSTDNIGFDASRNNKIFGASTEVQMPNATVKLWKRVS